MKLKKTIINNVIIDEKGEEYIPLKKSSLPKLILLTSNIRFVRFERDKAIYIPIKEEIRILKEELPFYEKDSEKKEVIENNIIFLNNVLNKKKYELKPKQKETKRREKRGEIFNFILNYKQ